MTQVFGQEIFKINKSRHDEHWLKIFYKETCIRKVTKLAYINPHLVH